MKKLSVNGVNEHNKMSSRLSSKERVPEFTDASCISQYVSSESCQALIANILKIRSGNSLQDSPNEQQNKGCVKKRIQPECRIVDLTST